VTADGARAPGLRVAVAHDWLVRYAGSERVVEQLLATFPGARLLTTVFDPPALPPSLQNAEPAPLFKALPGAHRRHEWLLPLMPAAWRFRTAVSDVDVVVSSSHACAKAVRVADGIPHVCYCHTPMRYAWDFEQEANRFPSLIRPAAGAAMRGFRLWDRRTAANVTTFVGNSTAVAARIRASYDRDAAIVFPPVDTSFFTPSDEPRAHFLFVGRMTGYKRPDLVVDAFRHVRERVVMVGDGDLATRLRATAPANVEFRSGVSPEELRSLYRTAQAFVFPAVEDFGIAMAEAQACGTPVVATRAGGALDIVDDGRTGWLADRQDVDSLVEAISRAVAATPDREAIRRSAERFSVAAFRTGMQDIVASTLQEKDEWRSRAA
jgi:glycosyltransferase involved in cell wall biosynthesis